MSIHTFDIELVTLKRQVNNLFNFTDTNSMKRGKIESGINLLTIKDRNLANYLKQHRTSLGYYTNIFQMIVSEENLRLAWDEIKNNYNNLSAIHENASICSSKLCAELSKKLILGTYKYQSTERFQVSEVTCKKFSYFSIVNFKDRIVQQAFYRVLNLIFEGVWARKIVLEENIITIPKKSFQVKSFRYIKKTFVVDWIIPSVFLMNSHGFRPNRSCHTALQEVCLKWRSVS